MDHRINVARRGAQTGAVDFYAHWADGKAEISSYEVVQPRYGELRQGYGVMIFVTESLHRQTFIKADPPTPEEPTQFYALKLNHILNFTTGDLRLFGDDLGVQPSGGRAAAL